MISFCRAPSHVQKKMLIFADQSGLSGDFILVLIDSVLSGNTAEACSGFHITGRGVMCVRLVASCTLVVGT
jgi:hypothetical protein